MNKEAYEKMIFRHGKVSGDFNFDRSMITNIAQLLKLKENEIKRPLNAAAIYKNQKRGGGRLLKWDVIVGRNGEAALLSLQMHKGEYGRSPMDFAVCEIPKDMVEEVVRLGADAASGYFAANSIYYNEGILGPMVLVDTLLEVGRIVGADFPPRACW